MERRANRENDGEERCKEKKLETRGKGYKEKELSRREKGYSKVLERRGNRGEKEGCTKENGGERIGTET